MINSRERRCADLLLRVAITLLPIASCFVCATSAAETPFVFDANGGSAFFNQRLEPRVNGPSILDELSGEEVALSSAVLVQGRVTRRLAVGVNHYVVTIERVFFSVGETARPRLASSYKIIDGGPFIIPMGSDPVLSVHPLFVSYGEQNVEVTQGVPASIGYARDGALTYRGIKGLEQYSLVAGDTLFSCLWRLPSQGLYCRNDRLRGFGIQSSRQRLVFDSLTAQDSLATMLWFLIRRRDPRAEFPVMRCTKNIFKGCASSRAFEQRLKFTPTT